MAHITNSNDQEEIYENETDLSIYTLPTQRREDEETYCEIQPTDIIHHRTDNPRKGFMCNSKLYIILSIFGMVVLVVASSITTAVLIKKNMTNILMDMTNEIQSIKSNKSGYLVSNNHKDRNWGSWNSWGSCTATCGGGLRTRTRLCNNPAPSFMGQFCQGSSLKTEICTTKPCHGILFSAFSVKTPNGYVSSRMTFSSTIHNTGGDYRTSTGTFTCSKPGVYYFAISLVKKRVSPTSRDIDQVGCYLYKGSSRILKVWVDPKDDTTDEGSTQAAGSALIHLNRNEYVYLASCHSSNKTHYESWSSFSGFLVNLDD